MSMKNRLFVPVVFCSCVFLTACAVNRPAPNDADAREWTEPVQASCPGFQPPEQAPQGNPEYEAQFKDAKSVDAEADKDFQIASSEPINAMTEKTAETASAPVVADTEAPKTVETVTADTKQTVEQTPVAAALTQTAQPAEQTPVATTTSAEAVQPKAQTPVAAPQIKFASFTRIDIAHPKDSNTVIYKLNGELVTKDALTTYLDKVPANAKNGKFTILVYVADNQVSNDELRKLVQGCKDKGFDRISVVTYADLGETGTPAVQEQKPATTVAPSNVKKVVRVDETQPAEEYEVLDNETLSSIALKKYHDAKLWNIIFEANKELLKNNPNRLRSGSKILIPALIVETK